MSFREAAGLKQHLGCPGWRTPQCSRKGGTEKLRSSGPPAVMGCPVIAALITQLIGVPRRAFQVMSIELILSLTISRMYVPYLKKKNLYANIWLVKQGQLEIAVCIAKG